MRFRYPDSRYCYFRVLCFRIHHLQGTSGFRGWTSVQHRHFVSCGSGGEHFGVGGIALFSTVPAAVIVGTVGVIPAVCFVVFFIVGIKIIHGEAIVAGKEIDTGIVSCIIVIMIRIKPPYRSPEPEILHAASQAFQKSPSGRNGGSHGNGHSIQPICGWQGKNQPDTARRHPRLLRSV